MPSNNRSSKEYIAWPGFLRLHRKYTDRWYYVEVSHPLIVEILSNDARDRMW